MSRLALALSLVLATVPFVDPDDQPACRERCEEQYAEALAACSQSGRPDLCRETAADRRQECLDRCND